MTQLKTFFTFGRFAFRNSGICSVRGLACPLVVVVILTVGLLCVTMSDDYSSEASSLEFWVSFTLWLVASFTMVFAGSVCCHHDRKLFQRYQLEGTVQDAHVVRVERDRISGSDGNYRMVYHTTIEYDCAVMPNSYSPGAAVASCAVPMRIQKTINGSDAYHLATTQTPSDPPTIEVIVLPDYPKSAYPKVMVDSFLQAEQSQHDNCGSCEMLFLAVLLLVISGQLVGSILIQVNKGGYSIDYDIAPMVWMILSGELLLFLLIVFAVNKETSNLIMKGGRVMGAEELQSEETELSLTAPLVSAKGADGNDDETEYTMESSPA
jgi:hypothetical protein